MAGLAPACTLFEPFGYNNPTRPAASYTWPHPPPPSDYDRGALKPATWARKHTPIAVRGPMRLSLKKQDFWGNVNASDQFSPAAPPSSYNATLLTTSYAKTTPVPHPWTKEQANAETAEAASGGTLDVKTDIKDLAKTYAETATDPAEKYWWSERVNRLALIDAISSQRGLNGAEESAKSKILQEITKRARELAVMAIPAYVPAAAPPVAISAADIGTAVVAAIRGIRPTTVGRLATAATATTATAATTTSTSPSATATTTRAVPVKQEFARDIKEYKDAPPDTEVIIEAKSNDIAIAFESLMKLRYPAGFTEDNAKMWKAVLTKVLPSRGVKRPYGPLEPAEVGKDPMYARGYVIRKMNDANSLQFTAIGLKYLIDPDPEHPTQPGFEEITADPYTKLFPIFEASRIGVFAFNDGYKMQLDKKMLPSPPPLPP
jgi:hypothetical protein